MILNNLEASTSFKLLWNLVLPLLICLQVFVSVAAKYETPENALNQESNSQGKEFNLTLHWDVTPKTGKMFADKKVMPGYQLPEEYR